MTFADLASETSGSKPFAIIGDTQRTMLGETILLRESNDPERVALVEALNHEDLSFVVHLGDMVAAGHLLSDWIWFDHLFGALSEKKIPVMPALGNHDYWIRHETAFAHIKDRFPVFNETRWYSRVRNGIGLIWLDSNYRVLGRERWSEQVAWFEASLRQFQDRGDIRAVLVFTHHPPYSNSLVTGDNATVQWKIVPLTSTHDKVRGFFSGHAHGYERFSMSGKTFTVSAGGGGPRQPLRRGRLARHRDQVLITGPRPFHYLLVNAGADEKLRVTVKGFAKGETRVRVIEEFDL